ncbi:cysteine hydrolase family protein [Thiofilum flexile]|uniref:cysteine hydrolase family protein n=1 Tax=Thiofilum flexile TaxID=125627 RepID=UPI00037D2D7B|nr:isochorismatase family protein [Thiofilum flexile]
MSKALLLIDLQNDYFPAGAFPLWETEAALSAIENAIAQANAQQIPIIIIQHIANPAQGLAPFFNANTSGAEIHPRILAAAPTAPIVVKHFADSFEQTNLEQLLQEKGITELLIAGMMTQNCVTHTAISKAAEKYQVTILPDCCTTVSEMLHLIALHAVSTRVALLVSEQALANT